MLSSPLHRPHPAVPTPPVRRQRPQPLFLSPHPSSARDERQTYQPCRMRATAVPVTLKLPTLRQALVCSHLRCLLVVGVRQQPGRTERGRTLPPPRLRLRCPRSTQGTHQPMTPSSTQLLLLSAPALCLPTSALCPPSTSRAARWRWSNAASSGTATARAPLCCAQWACCPTNTRTRPASLSSTRSAERPGAGCRRAGQRGSGWTLCPGATAPTSGRPPRTSTASTP